ncbi:MAG: preprotein translocase subunit SecG [Pseudomonadales bacterium]|nr:preprotein translocase subunit SecG [Candidatus Woesebacteria bacterium]MCB9801755.1 preprotein translocase subunit SecG [Pseudomonadales bacterium]
MYTVLITFQIILAVVLIVSILLQAQGTGLGAAWSGGGETYHTRRGLEKVVFYLTIGSLVLFCINSIALLWMA